MDIEALRDYCLNKKHVEETLPFGPETLVFKVAGKMFLLTSLDSEDFRFNVKADPLKIEEQRENFSCVLPGYHQNKKHWNTILVDGSANTKQLHQWIDDSYDLVVKGLPKNIQKSLF